MAERTVTYFWDVLAWRASRPVQRMTWAERGMYREMLDEQRDKGSLPDCPMACADLLGGTPDEWIEAWPALRRNFVDRRSRARDGSATVHDPTDRDPHRRIVNLKMDRVMREQRAYFARKRASGQKGGHAKAQNRQGLRTSSASGVLVALPSSASAEVLAKASDLIRSEEIRSEEKRESTRGLAYNGRFLTVFRWQFAELGKRLAEHKREAFDLLRWFERVETDIEHGDPLPAEQAERWTWLLHRLYRDADLERPNLSRPPAEDWFEECKRLHGGACGLSQTVHHNRKLLDAGKAALQ